MNQSALKSRRPHNRQSLIGGAGFRSRTPMLLIDARGILVEANVACQELLGVLMAGCQGEHFEFLERRLRARWNGPIFAPDGLAATRFRHGVDGASQARVLETADLCVVVSESRFLSERYGPVRIRVSELPCVDSETGDCSGAIISLEIVELENSGNLRAAIDRRLGHELMWEVYASSYDQILPRLPFYQEVVERHFAALRGENVRMVLDLGAGTGSVAVRLLRLGKEVTAVDVCRAMLARLECKLDDQEAQRLTLIQDTAEHLPHFPDGSYDGVNVLLAFFDMDEPRSALQEAIRVLKPGGALIVTEPRERFNVAQLMECAEASLRGQGLLGPLAHAWNRIQTVAPLVRETITQQQSAGHAAARPVWHAEALLEILKSAGFTDLTFRESHLGNCATIFGRKPLASIG